MSGLDAVIRTVLRVAAYLFGLGGTFLGPDDGGTYFLALAIWLWIVNQPNPTPTEAPHD